MRRWRIHGTEQQLSSLMVRQIMGGVGTPHLAGNCLEAVAKVLPTTFCTIYVVGAKGSIEAVSAASSYGNVAERTAAQYIELRFDLVDPHMRWLATRQLPAKPQLWIGHHRGDDLTHPEYRDACYDRVGIRERASVLQLSPIGERAAISFYRSFAQPEFTDVDFKVIEQYAAFLAEVVTAHVRSAATAASGAGSALDAKLLTLSPRQREAIGQLLSGRAAKEAARLLGVEITTFRTLQYRAFAKLGIRTLRDLQHSSRH